MKDNKDKKFILIIMAVIICIIAIAGYTFSFKKNNIKEEKVAVDKIDNEKKTVINLKDVKDKLKAGKVIDIKDERSLCRVIDDSHFICNDSQSVYLKDEKNNNKEEIVKFGEDVSALYQGMYKDNIIYTWRSSETYNDKKYDKIKLCLYNKTSKKTEIIKESEIDKGSKNVSFKFQFNGCIRICNNNIFYAANSTENNGVDKVYQYDMDTRKEKILYSEKDNEHFINSFDADISSGYIICTVYDNKNNGYLKLVNIKNNSQKILAKFQNEVNVVMKYPNVAFKLNNEIHIYNIKKNDDDGLIKSNNEIKDMEIYDNKIFIKANNIYRYSLNDKKMYKLDYPDDFNKKYFGIGVSYGKASWYDEKGLHYIEIDK